MKLWIKAGLKILIAGLNQWIYNIKKDIIHPLKLATSMCGPQGTKI